MDDELEETDPMADVLAVLALVLDQNRRMRSALPAAEPAVDLVPALDGYGIFRGRCREVSERMAKLDPSLRVVRGHYYDGSWGAQPHWWCQREDGHIVDGTAMQFPSRGLGLYEEFDGNCSCEECGKTVREENAVFAGRYPCCSDDCALKLVGL